MCIQSDTMKMKLNTPCVAVPSRRPKSGGQNPGSHNERDIWEFQRLRTCWRRRLGDAHSCRSGISSLLHSNGIDRLCFAGWRCKSLANQRHCQSQENGPRTEESEALRGSMKKRKTIYKPFDAAAYLDNDAVIAEHVSAAA